MSLFQRMREGILYQLDPNKKFYLKITLFNQHFLAKLLVFNLCFLVLVFYSGCVSLYLRSRKMWNIHVVGWNSERVKRGDNQLVSTELPRGGCGSQGPIEGQTQTRQEFYFQLFFHFIYFIYFIYFILFIYFKFYFQQNLDSFNDMFLKIQVKIAPNSIVGNI